MLFSSPSFLTTVLTLVSYVTAAPTQTSSPLEERGSSVIIGYRTVSSAQAKIYANAGNTLVYTSMQMSAQIGSGVYTTYNRGGWAGSPSSWYCVILADSTALNGLNKAWVPEKHNGDVLWYATDNVIDSYITDLVDTWDPAQTLRLSIISGKGLTDVQMLIPPGLLNQNGGNLGITVQCSADINDIPDSDVDYTSWSNVRGLRTG